MIMSSKKNGLIRSSVILAAGLLVCLVLIAIFSKVVSSISAAMTYNTTLAVKKNMLSEYVNNMIIYIDGERKAFLENNPDATEEDAEKEMIRLARKRIYEEQHSDGAYMWIQKVLDYNGGDD